MCVYMILLQLLRRVIYLYMRTSSPNIQMISAMWVALINVPARVDLFKLTVLPLFHFPPREIPTSHAGIFSVMRCNSFGRREMSQKIYPARLIIKRNIFPTAYIAFLVVEPPQHISRTSRTHTLHWDKAAKVKKKMSSLRSHALMKSRASAADSSCVISRYIFSRVV